MTTTLEQACIWVAEATGLQWPQDQKKVIARVNDVRELLYDTSTYGWQTTLTVPVRQFLDGPGISLPRFVENVLGVYNPHTNLAVPVVDRWGVYPFDEAHYQTCCQRYGHEVMIDLGEEFPFLNDPPCGCFRIQLLAKKKADVGKVVTLRYLDANDIDREEEIMLGALPVATQYTIKTFERNGVSLPLDLHGPISVKTTDGVLLSEWQPWETVPGYRRFRFKMDCRSSCMLIVHVERRRAPLFELTAPVETSQKLIWQDGARYLVLHNKTNGDQADAANASKFFASFVSKVQEATKRLQGRTHKRALNFTGLVPRRSGLLRGR